MLTTRLFAACAALALSGCVVMEAIPPQAGGPGPFLTGGQTNVPSAAPQIAAPVPTMSLSDQLSGGMMSNELAQIVLRPDGTLQGWGMVLGMRSNVTGTWSATGNTLCTEIFISGARESGGCGPAELRGSQLVFRPNSGSEEIWSFRR